MKSPLKRPQIRHILLTFMTILCALSPLQVYADDDQSDLHFIKYNAPFYDPNDTCDPGAVTASTTTGGPPATPGSDNEETIWNNLISKGLKPFQAAGIMGNMQSESGFDPFIIQGGGHSFIPSAAGGGGYGLVQWTPGSKLIPYLNGQPIAQTAPAAIAQEVSALWAQLTGVGPSSEKGAGDAILASTDVQSATIAFELKYERHAGDPQPARTSQAQAILALAVSKNWTQAAAPGALGTPVSSSSGGCGATATNAAVTGGCANPFPDPAWKDYLSRTDDGVDYFPKQAMPILAPCDLKILGVDPHSGWPGANGSATAPFIYAQIMSGPFKDKCWYIAENIGDLPAVNSTIPAGQKVATANANPNSATDSGIEVGFAQAQNLSAMRVGAGNYPAPSGRAVAKFLRSLGAPTRDDPGTDAPDYAGGTCKI